MNDNQEAILADIRERNDERKAAETGGVIGGVRTGFDVDFLLRYIDSLCICGTPQQPLCTDDHSQNACPHCKSLDIYDPCPTQGFGCGSIPDIECDCCTPEQRKAAAQ